VAATRAPFQFQPTKFQPTSARQPRPGNDFGATKARTIRVGGIEIIVSLQRGNVIEFPCFRLKHAFEFQSLV
jgi:hypothetical protein